MANKENNYRLINQQLIQVKEFSKKVRFVYKYGIEIQDDINYLFKALAVAPYIYKSDNLINMLVGSGVLNCFLVG